MIAQHDHPATTDAKKSGPIGVVLCNLGGPDSPRAIEPFLFNLFSDPAIIRLPNPLRWLIAKIISRRRAPITAEIYAKIGGRSPLWAETDAQARALDAQLKTLGITAQSVIAMRYWHPFAEEAAAVLKQLAVEKIVLLPLYPQFSTTTTQSSFADWDRAAAKIGLNVPTARIDSYPTDPYFIAAHAERIEHAVKNAGLTLDDPLDRPVRLLFSAHGLPEKIVHGGDPYPLQVQASVDAVVKALARPGLDVRLSYQSRVGPLKWIGPATEDEIKTAGAEGKTLVLIPIAFVSEHSETLVELDIDYKNLALAAGVPTYIRVPTLGVSAPFIAGLAHLVAAALAKEPFGG